MAEQRLNLRWIDTTRDDAASHIAQLRNLLSPRGDVVTESGRQRTIEVFGESLTPAQVVERICRDVQSRGLEAALELTKKIDKVNLTPETVRVSAEQMRDAANAVEREFLETVDRVADRIRRFQKAILHRDVRIEVEGGYLMERYRPLRRVGICVPGGAAAYPSTVLMTAVPAQVAGVEQIAIIAPPTEFGANNKYVLATCYQLGISEVYRLGGAQGVATLAYGAEPIEKVDKIVGPGNLFVALAKRFVYGEVDIDAIAGPSEVVVIVDDSTRADFTAWDLIAQAEHAPGVSILIGWQREPLEKAVTELERQLAKAERGHLARECIESFGAVILAQDPDEACTIVDQIAPEHLHIATKNADELAEKIRNAGAVFLGNYSPVALGDYAAGPSHVLPTSGTARFASGLSANDFLRAHSVLCFTREGLLELLPDVCRLAECEGLEAHKRSAEIRAQQE